MKVKSIILVVLIAAVTISCQKSGTSGDVTLTNQKDSLSYAIGLQLGKSVEGQKFDVNIEIVQHAFVAGYSDTAYQMTPAESQKIIMAVQQENQARIAEENKVKAVENVKIGENFLAANKVKDGVIVTESGLQYKVLTEGSGSIPKASEKVKAHYKGTLIDGTQFDSSYDRGEPSVFPVTGVIKGWQEALQLMPVGSKWELYIPSDLAYGPSGSRNTIGPNEVLIFTIELVSIEK